MRMKTESTYKYLNVGGNNETVVIRSLQYTIGQ